jgi:amino acid transporter
MNIELQAKLTAFGIHLFFTFFTALVSAVLVLFVWYPHEYKTILSGIELYRLLLVVEVLLGPVMSFVIYNPKKKQKELLTDYSIVVAVQLAALVYGVYTVYSARPVYEVVVKDRVEIVSANELSKDDLALADSLWSAFPKLGPRIVCVDFPAGAKERTALAELWLATGRDIQYLPQYYRECDDRGLAEVFRSVAELSEELIAGGSIEFTGDELWLPVFFMGNEYVAVLDESRKKVAHYYQYNGELFE